MGKNTENILLSEISRKKFLRYALGTMVLVSLPLDWLCRSKAETTNSAMEIPLLKGLSGQEYLNINCMAEVFLVDSPVPDFDAGYAMDQYIYNRQEPLSIEKKLKDLFAVPSSVLIAVIFNFSFVPMKDLPLNERVMRLQNWKTSFLSIKRTVYHAYRQGTLLMLTSSKKYQDFTGYTQERYFLPFNKNGAYAEK